MTTEQLTALNLPVDMSDGMTALAVESGLDWIARNTTFIYDPAVELPANVRLFLLKYTELMTADGHVTSESLGGMSQSFADGTQAAYLLRQYASELLGEWYKSATFTPATNRWA